MQFDANQILAILDRCCAAFTFPMLDNGYVYPAGTRLSLYRTAADWAMVIEVFGYSPRAGLPDTHIHTFANALHNRTPAEGFVNRDSYDKYLANNPHNDIRFIFPIEEGAWQDAVDGELVNQDAKEIVVRGRALPLPALEEYERRGIQPEKPPQIQVFELCRFLADIARESVLATSEERRVNVPPDMTQILQLEDWHHPNVGDNKDRPGGSETFRQLAQVLVTGNTGIYRPSERPNTHWRNWPEGGRL